MLHLQLRVPAELTDRVVGLLTADDTVTNVAVIEGGFRKPPGALVLADVAREGANPVIAALRELDLQHVGAITLSEPSTTLSDAAEEAEESAPGDPDDSVVWDVVEHRVRTESRLTWAYCSFLTLATLIAGAGRLLDQPILIIGAMVVGPDFTPVAAICLALALPRLSLLPQAVSTLLVGFLIAVTVAAPLWFLGRVTGLVSVADATRGELTSFIVHPDVWSLLIAMLAGVAGVLSLTTPKSGPLVGVFIAVATIPSVGTIALCVGTGVWSEVDNAALQLGLNILGLLVAGTLALLVQRLVWSRIQRGKQHAL